MASSYAYYCDVFRNRTMPFAFVDLDLFDKNVEAVLQRAGDKPICLASKSIRCIGMLRRIQHASPRFHSIMAYSVREAVFLCEQGFDNILVAYPVLSEARAPGFVEAVRQGKTVTLMVDCRGHVDLLDDLGRSHDLVVPLCMDVDMADVYPGLYFGVRRSPVRTVEDALALWEHIRRCRHVRLDGVMGYEAQIAGLPDSPPGTFAKNLLVRLLKGRSVRRVAARRTEIVGALKRAGCSLRFVNGGGTGSVESTREEDVVTEVTVGSGFYAPALFDHYARFRHEACAGFALEVVRRPGPHIYTCQGGGYIASGPAHPNRLPSPWLPEGAQLTSTEGAGEVQTPVLYRGAEVLDLGSPIFMRHAKAGELCERFNTLLLAANGSVVDEVATYRGGGKCFI